MAKIRVLLLMHELSLTGAPEVAMSAFERMHDDIDVRVLSLGGGAAEERCRKMGDLAVITGFPQDQGWFAQRKWRREREALERSLSEWKPDLIYVNTVAAIPIAAQVNLPKVKTLMHIHEMRSFLSIFAKHYPDLLCNWPDRYIAVSQAVFDVMTKRFSIDPSKISVIHAFTDERAYESLPSASPKRQRDPFIVGGCGHPRWHKGCDLWVRTAHELKSILGKDAFRFVWVGLIEKDEYSWQFQQMARLLGVDDLIDFIPHGPGAIDHFQRFDVFASTSWEDSCPLVVLESMMSQKPVLCFAGSGGAKEEVGETGIAIEDFSPRDMASAIADLMKSPERRAELGSAARERVMESFTARVQVPKILAEIRRVVR